MFNKFLFHIIIILIFNFFNIHCETAEEFCDKPENFDDILCLSVSKQFLTNLITLSPSELDPEKRKEFINLSENGKNRYLNFLKNQINETSEENLGIIENISEYLSLFVCNKNDDINNYTECFRNKTSLMNFTYDFISNITGKIFSKKRNFDFRIIDLYLKCLFYSLNSPESFSNKSILTFFETIKIIIDNNDKIIDLIKSNKNKIKDYFTLELNIISNSFNLKDFSEIKNIFETKNNKNNKNVNDFFYINDFLQDYIKKITSLNKYLLQYEITIETKNIYYYPIFNFDDDKFEVSNYTIETIYIPNKHLKSLKEFKEMKGIGIFIFNNFLIFNRNSVINKFILPTIVSMKIFNKDYNELDITHIPLDAYYTIEFQRENEKFKYCYEYFPNENSANADDIKTENFDDDYIKCRPHNFGSFFIGHIDMNGEILISNSQVVQIIFILIGCFALVVITGIIMIKLVYKSTNLDISFQDDSLTASLGIKFDENNNNNNVLDNNNNNNK